MTEPNQESVLYLHIGMGKSGSSTIQEHLHLLDDVSFGTLPTKAFGFPNAVKLVAASKSNSAHRFFVQKHKSMTEEFFVQNAESLWDEIRSEIANSPNNRFVASSEFLCNLVRGDDIVYLKEKLLTCFDRVQLIVYFREQRSYLRSLWGQSVKGPGRSCRSFSDFVSGLENSPRIWDYSLFVRDWQDAFGRASLNACVFDKQAFLAGDLISDFFNKIDVPTITGMENLKKRTNVSPSFEELEAIRQKNISRSSDWRERYLGRFKRQKEIDPEAFDALVTRLASPGNTWINENILQSQKVKLPVA